VSTLSIDFLAQIAADIEKDPIEWESMLIYADYLEEQGSPEAVAWRWIARAAKVRKWLRKRLVWADVEQACETKPLYWYQQFFRWLGWP